MPNLSCRTCGRQIYTVTPLASLFAEERRCPRCGASLFDDRRGEERRTEQRRKNPPNDPGPPVPEPAVSGGGRRKSAHPAEIAAVERRVADRRSERRRTKV